MARPEHFVIKGWSKFQHYKDRNPPWIKLHVEILSSEDWVTLADASKLLMTVCMVIAAKNDGRVPNNPAYIKRVAYLDTTPDFRPLISCGFLQNPLADASERKQEQAEFRPEAEAEAEADTLEANASRGTPSPKSNSSKGTRLASDWKPSEEHRAYARELGYTDAEADAELAEFFEYFTGPDARQPVKKSWDRAVQRWLRESSSRRFAKRTRSRQPGANRSGAGSVFAALCENLEAGDLGEPGDGTRMGRGADENRVDEGTPGTGPLGSPEAGGQVIDADHWRRVSEGAGETEVDDEGEGGIDRGHSADASSLRGRSAEIPGGRGAACPGYAEEHEPLVAGVVGIEGEAGSAHGEAQAPHGGPDFDPVADMHDAAENIAAESPPTLRVASG